MRGPTWRAWAGAPEQSAARSLDDALAKGTTHVGDDWQQLVAHPHIDIVIECTGNPPAAVEHCLAAFRHGKHVVNVTVEADAFCGPLLARKAAEAGVIYSLAYGDQPALICDLVDWARTAGFPCRRGRTRPQMAAAFRAVDAGDRMGPLRPDAGAGARRRPESEDVQFVPRRLEAGDREHRRVQRDRSGRAARRTDLSAGFGRRHSVRLPPDQRRRRAAPARARSRWSPRWNATGASIPYDIRFGVFVVFEGETEYIRNCFKEYRVRTDPSGRYACLYKRWHLIGLEVGNLGGVGGPARRSRPAAPTGFRADVVATAKRDLKPGETLDGEGGYTVVRQARTRHAIRSHSADCRWVSRTTSNCCARSRPVRPCAGATSSSTNRPPQ